ncbi:MAG TPA: hypothetical protein GXZ55_04455 [Natronincola sp.]|nr:hypothetical protein [Natronincola sp.]
MSILVMYAHSCEIQVGLSCGPIFETCFFTLESDNKGCLQKTIEGWIESALPKESELELIVINESNSKGIVEEADSLCIATSLGKRYGTQVFVVKATNVSEYNPKALITGTPAINRGYNGDIFIFEYLARQQSKKLNKPMENANFIVANLDKEIHIGALSGGKVIDMISSENEGPFSETQSGGIPFGQLLDLCQTLGNEEKALRIISEKSGLRGYLNPCDFTNIWSSVNEAVILVRSAFAYQIAKEIGAFSAVLKGNIDAIVLSGELAKNTIFVKDLVQRIYFLGDIVIVPGNYGLIALLEEAKSILKERINS